MNNKSNFRKGVFVYFDLIKMLDSLTDEQFGRAIRIFACSSCGEEKAASNDETVNLAAACLTLWDSIDRAKYEKILEKRREAGAKGAEKRWGNGKEKEEIV